ncbi:MAG TPA: hypothetical protein VFO79_07200 [Xanthomonadales bacterium]|nr:hypothetical protein [Xanthomonadales bacterium]
MRLLAIVVGLAFATSAAADPKPAAAPAKPEAAKCKRKVVGKGLERKVVCVFEQEIVVSSEQAKPKVVIVPVDGRKVVGRPKTTDPFAGLSRRRESN